MKGLFNKIMNKINELPNPEGLKIPKQNQNKTQTINNIPQNINSSQNTVVKNNLKNSQINELNNNNVNNVNTINKINEQNIIKNKVDNQIVIVNEKQVENKIQGYYYKKHIDDIRKLKVNEPIIFQRQKMKINFDIDILDYLFNDMTEIFKHKSNIVEENKNELIKKINETYNLVNILSEINKNSDDCINKYMKEKKIMENVEFLEIFIKSLSQEVNDLLSDIAKFEQIMMNENKEKSINK